MQPHVKRTSKSRRDRSEEQQSDCGERKERHAREGGRESGGTQGHHGTRERELELVVREKGSKPGLQSGGFGKGAPDAPPDENTSALVLLRGSIRAALLALFGGVGPAHWKSP
jgi:hypothetical protein